MGDGDQGNTSAPCTVETSLGTLRGSESNGVRRFFAVPYAEPPVGELRFAKPAPVAPWTGERAADRFGATAPQSPYTGALGELIVAASLPGDDYLTAQIWAPATAHKAPVVLWIHGGAFERGSAAQSGTDGTAFAQHGVVLVAINYRLGAEGFSVLDGAPRNLGLLDAACALEWVSREIAAFGGDPTRITLMGESAGGSLVAALLAEPQRAALVAGAIIQSGPLEAQSVHRGRRASDAIAKHLGISPTREQFAAYSPADLLAARSAIAAGSSPLSGAPGYALVRDPDTLPVSPSEALVTTAVPLLMGTNTDEYRLWFTPEALAGIGRLKAWLARRALHLPERAARAVLEQFPNASPGERLGQLITDSLLRAPATRLATERAASGDPRRATFLYEFAWNSPVRDLRAAHAVEIGFVFTTLESADGIRLSGAHAPHALAEEMQHAWLGLIMTGDPGWPVWAGDRVTRVFATPSLTVPQRRADVVTALLR